MPLPTTTMATYTHDTPSRLRHHPLLTASLVLELLESADLDPWNTCSSPTCSTSCSDVLPSSAAVQGKIASIRHMLQGTTAASPKFLKGDCIDLLDATVNDGSGPSAPAGVSAPSSSNGSATDYSFSSSEGTKENLGGKYDDEVEDRGRMGAEDRALSRVSLEDSRRHGKTPQRIRRRASFKQQDDVSPLDEFDDPSLAGAAAALHGYRASGGDPVFLEKAYEMARGVAGSKHDLSVAFDACRMALAVGYVHTLTKGEPDMANTFARQHSLAKLAQSLRPYWSRSPLPGPKEDLEWEECMYSLLEVASSVALLTGERDVLSILDSEVHDGVKEAIGSFLVGRQGAFQQYQDVGIVCLRHHLLSLGTGWRNSTDSE